VDKRRQGVNGSPGTYASNGCGATRLPVLSTAGMITSLNVT
jgi:hypothetical protein